MAYGMILGGVIMAAGIAAGVLAADWWLRR